MEPRTLLTALFTFLNLWLVNSNPILKATPCTANACHPLNPDKVNVHLVPHSHDDVGWLQTYQGYYQGSGNFDSYMDAGVRFILDSTIPALLSNPDRRYIQVETAFFFKWWNDQTQETRDAVRELVNSGRLEMINGGWSMNDEAAAHYHSIIDQFTWGFRILEDTVGECGRPTFGWQIDPFGHSREHASLQTQFGFDGLLVGRIDFRDKNKRIEEKNLDFIWNTNDNFDANIFTTMFPNFYIYEGGFCFDVYCQDDNITDSNLQDKVNDFTNILNNYRNFYKTNNILIPMGGDFTYQKADKNFDNLDNLIAGFVDHPDFNLIYSTPTCYMRAVQDELNRNGIALTEKTDDFFPYASDPHAYWTGYFTSRPTSKRFERVGNNILQSAKQLTTFARINGGNEDDALLDLRSAMGVMQHHDAITGTEKQAVADDYSTMLHGGIQNAETAANQVISGLLSKTDAAVDLNLSSCLLANVSVCANSGKDQFIVAIHNPLSKVVSHYVKLPVFSANFRIRGPDNERVQYDVFDLLNDFDFITDEDKAPFELVFLASDLPPLGVKLYYIQNLGNESNAYNNWQDITDQDTNFGTESNGFTIDPNSGKLQTVRINGVEKNVNQEYLFYHGFTGSNEDNDHRSSGAYVFRPDGNDAIPVASDFAVKKYARGNFVDQVLQVVNDEISQIIRVYKGDDDADAYIEFDWLIGDLQTDDRSREIVTRITVGDFHNNQVFYTDSNGRQQIRRQLNSRPDYSYDSSEEPVTSNYYPITTKIVLKDTDQNLEVAVLNDRAQGGTSLQDGTIELMVHRRELNDDNFGVQEALNEQQFGRGLYARGQHYLTFGGADSTGTNGRSTAAFERDLARRKLLAPWVLLGDATGDDLNTLAKAQDLLNFRFDVLQKIVPDNLHILTLEPWKNSYLLRLEHVLEKGEDDNLSQDVTIDLSNLFSLFQITDFTETTLGANIPTQDVDMSSVTLGPMEIRTFVFKTDQQNDGGTYNGIVNPDQ